MASPRALLLELRRTLLGLTQRLAWLAPALMRVTLGVVFIQSGWGKLHNLDDATAFFTELGIPMPHFNAVLASSTEVVGGFLVLIGLGARLAALPLAFTMVIAIITAKRAEIDGLAALLGLSEWAYLVMFLVIALLGPGALSLDALIVRRLQRAEAGGAVQDPAMPAGAAPLVR
jgi:putative oxidoreductase